MNALIVSDLHFTNNPRDAYRWKLFPWLREAIPKNNVKLLWVMGDLCEEKDRHPAQLVNKVVDELLLTYRQTGLSTIYILRGNHDGVDPNTSYFKFLGKYPCIQFVETPFSAPFNDREVLMLPHTTNPKDAWKNVEMHLADYIFMHATIKGAISESGMQLDGIPAGLLASAHKAKIYSGDIHMPQTVKLGRVEVTYIGAPYPVRFGDNFEPRAVLIENFRTSKSLPIPAIKRQTCTITPDAPLLLGKFVAGDQIKVRIRLTPSEYGDWAQLKKKVVSACTDAGVELCGLELEKVENKIKLRSPTVAVTKDPKKVVTEFCASHKLSDALTKEGTKLLTETLI